MHADLQDSLNIIATTCGDNKLKLFIKTYGCQMNVYDSTRMQELLAAQGYVVNSPDPSALQLTIVVESLTYQPQEQAVGNDIRLAAVLRADVTKQGETFSGRYQSNADVWRAAREWRAHSSRR